jgi:UDP-N-acetylmuramyl tripeptide synthase
MKIKRFRSLAGPNVYSHRPVILLTLDLEELSDRKIGDVADFSEKVLKITTFTQPSPDYRAKSNNFVERPSTEINFAQAVQFVALELMNRADVGTNSGSTHRAGEKGVYNVAVEYKSAAATKFLLETAVELLEALIENEDFALAEKIAEAKNVAAENEFGANVKATIEAAEKRGIPWMINEETDTLQFGYGKNLRLLSTSSLDENSIGKKSAEMKEERNLSTDILGEIGETVDGDALIEKLYPNGAESRISLVAITGTNGKTTVTRMIAHILRATGLNIGTATTEGILFNGESVQTGDTTGPASARKILSNAAVDIAVLETARGGIVRRGLGWDWADVGVVTNITEDHIGQDGIESVEDLVWIKSLIAERVRAGGTLVLNAEDEQSADLANRRAVRQVPKKIVYFAVSEDNPIVQTHLEKGETAYFTRNGWIVEASGENLTEIVEIAKIPVTIGGTAEFQIQNAMAATAVCRALQMTPDKIAAALERFRSDEHNAGRNNFYRVGGGYALIDYGHNPKAFEAICRMTARWTDKRTIGIVSVPGDRNDELIIKAGRIAVAGFDRIIIKGDHNLRGRQQGEIAEMLNRLASEAGKQNECEVVLNAEEAFEREIAAIRENEVIVFFYEKLEPVLETLKKYGAVPTTTF